jgi:hypothetical protein
MPMLEEETKHLLLVTRYTKGCPALRPAVHAPRGLLELHADPESPLHLKEF